MSQLTLLTGVNSCGKSSVIQALLLLRQSFKKSRIEKGLDLNNPLTSIGIGQDALYRYASDSILKFEITDETSTHVFEYEMSNSLKDSFIPLNGPCSTNNTVKELSDNSLFNTHFQYVSALRWGARSTFPMDTFEATEERQISLNYGQGELVANFLHKFADMPTYNYRVNDGSKLPLLDQTIFWEQQISAGLTIDIEQTADKTGYSIIYGTKGDGKKPITDLRAENIGFGISYTLPVIVSLLAAEPGSLIIIENPEAHLHPNGQSVLAELICAVSQHGIQVVVETHSDHIVNGVLVACKQFEKENGKCGISRNNVAIYFFSQKDEMQASVCQRVEIEEEGHLKYQPKGFFDRTEEDRSYLFFD